VSEALRGKKVWARRPFGYAGRDIAEGEIFELGGYANDALLVRFRYVDEVPKSKKHHEHGVTGRKFIEGGYLDKFGQALQQRRQEGLTYVEAGYGMVDTTGDAEQRRLNAEAPLGER
jgi:hypothetical protein